MKSDLVIHIAMPAAALLCLAACFTAGCAFNTADQRESRAKENFHLFLLAGQSNMAGRGHIEEQDQLVDHRIVMLTRDGQWEYATAPIHYDKSAAGVCLAQTFAKAYADDHPGVKVGLVPAACGGSPISTWQPGEYWEQTHSHPYDDAIQRAQLAMQHGILKGILWHQGESDSSPELAPQYGQALKQLIARFRHDLHDDRLIVILGQLGQFDPWSESRQLVDHATQEVAKQDERIGFVRSDGLTSNEDRVHFNAASLREFGRRYYGVYRRIEQATP